ncbi:hypothetical protein [Halarcobacter ebronensis]|uniref:Uncharacterized protein n=1 Tax=Halarcobacter ebronensis TaxID=1462615 RepID=A0A4V1M0T4_9BACT|nr:hypothetical protein [Halarcobacter ebronensis]QKF83461.1 hypothetical protein AEBR_3015 [Halarcobacter ebronensis]RXK08260.1 hypothetical protein CRV07_00175 [Halarcobacter ebronensis]
MEEIIVCIKDVVLMSTAITASVVAVKGLSTWKKQLKGKDEYELCKRILIDLYKYQNGIRIVRNPAMFQYEYPEEIDRKKWNDKEKKYKKLVYAYEKRWQHIQDNRIKLNLSIIESKVYWENELEKLFKPIFEFENKLFNSVQDILLTNNPDQDDEYKKVVQKNFYEEKKSKILYFLGEKDEFDNKLEDNIKEIENFIRAKLKK